MTIDLSARTAAAAIAALAAVAAHAQPADSMAQRMQACTACHGQEGRSTPEGYFPRIAGKPAGYLYNQLVAFREGRRRNAVMTYLIEHFSPAYLREISTYFANLDLPYAPAPKTDAAAAVLRRGAELVTRGDAARGVPACIACHGERLTGVQPATPGLVGLPRDYLIAQLGAWRTRVRQAIPPDCMRDIADRLAGEDVTAVAAWLAAQTPPADAKPDPPPHGASPVVCGSRYTP